MKCRSTGAIILVWILLGASLFSAASATSPSPMLVLPLAEEPGMPSSRIPADFFTENAGQVDNPEVLYYARGGGISVGFAAGAVLINLRERPPNDDFNPRSGPGFHVPDAPEAPTSPLRGHLVRITFEGANPVLPRARNELPHRANFFLGDDPARWHTSVRNYREVVYESAWDGIDVVYRASPGGVKYDLVVHPGADLANVAFTYEGVTELAVTPSGLTAETSLGPLHDDLPAAWQASGRPVDCGLRRIAERTVGFACSVWDGTGDLVIDPLLYSSFLGGSGDDWGYGIAVDASGSAYVTGATRGATDFPTTPGAYNTTQNGFQDAFVAKLDANGSALLYATFLGGSGEDWGEGISVDASGAAYVIGTTRDDVTDFPTTPGAYNTTHNGGFYDAFVAKLDANGSALLYATFLGGSGEDRGQGIAIDTTGAYVTGYTSDTLMDFPTTPGAYDMTQNGFDDAFVAKLDPSGSGLIYSTFLGGSSSEQSYRIAVDASGAAYVTGSTVSADFPATPGAYDTMPNGGTDAFVAKFDASGGSLQYSTFLGGSSLDVGQGIAVDTTGAAYVTGYTWDDATDFPATPGAYDTTHNGGLYDAFVAKLDANGSALLYATFLGGTRDDIGIGVAVDTSGAAYVTGWTYDDVTDFPVTPGAYDTTHNGLYDAFVAKLDANGSALLYATFLGGRGSDFGNGIAIDASAVVYLTGWTDDYVTDFPTTPGAYDTTHNDGIDVFVAKMFSKPLLSPTEEPNYVADGLEPEAGTLAALYVYRVNYSDADGDPPATGDPKVHIRNGGVAIPGSPFPMVEVDLFDADVTDGKWYAYTTPLAPRSTDYDYYFTASDTTGKTAADWPAPPADAPDVLNTPPLVDAGEDRSGVFRGMVVMVDGTASTDPDGDPLTHNWVQVAGPAVTLSNPSGAVADFTPTELGVYAFQLKVDDGFGGNATDTVTVTVLNRAPTAIAGAVRTARVGELLTVNATASTDPDGDALAFSWAVSPAGVALSNPNTATPTFTPRATGTYTFTLRVDDGNGGNDSATVTITVEAPDSTLLFAVVGIGLLVLIVLLILFFLRKKKKPVEEETPAGEKGAGEEPRGDQGKDAKAAKGEASAKTGGQG